ncbi:MAG TPA: nickel-dependent lactate racemase [Acidobacteriota bacterium]|nr:nickel-dependent lactate racemase [Acidobacteriota bacterium]
MNRIELKYGDGIVEFDPGGRRIDLLQPDPPRRPLDGGGIRSALASPVESPPLGEIARGRHSALVVVSDATRVARADLILPALLEELAAAGIERRSVKIAVALGNHRRVTPAEIDLLLAGAARGLEIVQHDSCDEESLRSVGRTSRGIDVRLSSLLFDHDLVITISAVNFHYFAGFGGGRKSIIPGLAAHETIITNHLLAVDFERGRLADGVEPGRLGGNPVNEDMEEGVALHPPDFAVHVILTPNKEIGAVWAGDWKAAFRGACGVFLKRFGVTISERRSLVLASAGGHPKDIDFIQSHKTIQLATAALVPGGTLVLLARCGEGIGSRDFRSYFPLNDLDVFLQNLKGGGLRNGQTAMALHAKAGEYRIVLVSELPQKDVVEMGMEPAGSLREALATATGDAPAYVIPDGGTTLPLPIK